MDKHDRPYRCPHASCAKLQGFTYSGGLLRHEREVHGKHGGPKTQLMCPHTDCKRHSGKGFTRKENLNEHLRRVHNGKEQGSQQEPMLQHNGTEIVTGTVTQDGEPTRTNGEDLSENIEPSLKRKRSLPPVTPYEAAADLDNLKQEIDRLRVDVALKDEHIRQMQNNEAANIERIHQLEQANQQLEHENTYYRNAQHQEQLQHTQQPEQLDASPEKVEQPVQE